MKEERIRNCVTLTYKVLNDEGKTISRSNTINNLSNELTNEKVFEFALLIKDICAYDNDKIIKKQEDLLLED